MHCDPRRWCEDLRCKKCYGADTWQRSRIAELERHLEDAQTVIDREQAERAEDARRIAELEAALRLIHADLSIDLRRTNHGAVNCNYCLAAHRRVHTAIDAARKEGLG